MAARPTMANLITRVRRMISDPAGASQTFDDDAIQEALDRYSTMVNLLALTAQETILSGGSVVYVDYWAPFGDWEEDAKLQGANYATLTPSASDYQQGHWTFAAQQPGSVLITGKVYDLNGAAADLLEEWAAKVKLQFDFGTDGQDFKRSQQVKHLQELAQSYRSRQKPKIVSQVRDDVSGDW